MRKIVNYVLAAVFLLTILVIGGVTLARSYKSVAYAGLVSYTQYAKKGARGLDTLRPRITAVENQINTRLLGKDALEKLNARFQLALGKQMLSFGANTMVRLRTGQLYDVQPDVDRKALQEEIDNIVLLKRKLEDMGIPLVYAYTHSELYEDDLLPGPVLDYNNAVADAIVTGLRAGGVDTIDTRDIYKEKGMTMDEAAMRTDAHGSILMAFEVYSAAARALNATGAIAIDTEKADIANFNVTRLPGAHMGDVGTRVGADQVEPDDFYMITPKFDTQIHQRIVMSTDDIRERDGTFEQAVLNLDILEGDGPHNIYDTYGKHTELVNYTNEGAPEGRLLIIKDSFGTPTASFMSLAVSDVCALDLRRTRRTPEQMVEEFKPDAVLIVHCQQMMRDKNFVFVE